MLLEWHAFDPVLQAGRAVAVPFSRSTGNGIAGCAAGEYDGWWVRSTLTTRQPSFAHLVEPIEQLREVCLRVRLDRQPLDPVLDPLGRDDLVLRYDHVRPWLFCCRSAAKPQAPTTSQHAGAPRSTSVIDVRREGDRSHARRDHSPHPALGRQRPTAYGEHGTRRMPPPRPPQMTRPANALDELALEGLGAGFLLALPRAAAEQLLADSIRINVPAGALIYRDDERPRLLVVVKGLLRIFLSSADGRQVTVRYARSGDVAGLALVIGGPGAMEHPGDDERAGRRPPHRRPARPAGHGPCASRACAQRS